MAKIKKDEALRVLQATSFSVDTTNHRAESPTKSVQDALDFFGIPYDSPDREPHGGGTAVNGEMNLMKLAALGAKLGRETDHYKKLAQKHEKERNDSVSVLEQAIAMVDTENHKVKIQNRDGKAEAALKFLDIPFEAGAEEAVVVHGAQNLMKLAQLSPALKEVNLKHYGEMLEARETLDDIRFIVKGGIASTTRLEAYDACIALGIAAHKKDNYPHQPEVTVPMSVLKQAAEEYGFSIKERARIDKSQKRL